MSWDYIYTAGGVDLTLYCENIRVLTEYGLAARRSHDHPNAGQHGTFYRSGKLLGAGNVDLNTYLRTSDENGAVTHVDGVAGHVYENMSVLKRIFNKTTGLVTLRRVAPHIGAQIMAVELIDLPTIGQNRYDIIWPLNSPKPLWRSETLQSNALSTGNFNPGGDAPMDDGILTMGTGASVFCAATRSGITANTGCVVNCGTGVVTITGSPARGAIEPFSARWLHLDGGVNNAIVVSGSVTLDHYAKWS